MNRAQARIMIDALNKLDGEGRLVVMSQNPSDGHRWSEPVGNFVTVDEMICLLKSYLGDDDG